ncbi:Scr1 family TA system antitoxin-like transcriptional regulator [Streptomyces bobili]
MTIKGPPIDSTQTGEVWDASAAVDEEALMASVCPRPLTAPAPLIGAQHREQPSACRNQRLRDSLEARCLNCRPSPPGVRAVRRRALPRQPCPCACRRPVRGTPRSPSPRRPPGRRRPAHEVPRSGGCSRRWPGGAGPSDHAQAVFKAALPPLPEHEVALRLAHRLERQRILAGDTPTGYVGMLHEAALRM